MTRDKKDIAIFGAAFLGFGLFWYAYLTAGHEVASAPKESATAAVVQAGPVAVPFTEIASGWKSSVTDPTNYLITSSEQLADAWKIIGATTPLPQIDWTTQSVLAVFAGQTADPISKVAVTSVIDSTERHVVVTITDSSTVCKGGKCTLGAPYQLIKVPATTLPLTSEYSLAQAPGTGVTPKPQ